MNTDIIFSFLKDIAANNNREWFAEHKEEYLQAMEEFEKGMERAIVRIGLFDASVAGLEVKDCMYRFNRDTRFSPDKSPYKRHFGHSLMRTERSRSVADITYIWNRATRCWLPEPTGFRRISSPPVATR